MLQMRLRRALFCGKKRLLGGQPKQLPLCTESDQSGFLLADLFLTWFMNWIWITNNKEIVVLKA